MLFLSPVFYKGSDLGGKLANIIAMNPLSWFIEALRGALLYGVQPSIKTNNDNCYHVTCFYVARLSVFQDASVRNSNEAVT